MKITVNQPVEVQIESIRLQLAVRYAEQDIPNDFPLRKGDIWTAVINIDSGKIRDWPDGRSGKLSMKVCDEGTYTLYDVKGFVVGNVLENSYVPHGVVPGEYGDYVNLEIDTNGKVVNWPKHPDVAAFFSQDE